MKKNTIVSLADSNYFPLLEELIESIKRFKESETIAICVLDAGLTHDQKEVLIMRMYRDMRFKEIAENTKVSINTALGRMRYAIINLRKLIEDHKIVLEI